MQLVGRAEVDGALDEPRQAVVTRRACGSTPTRSGRIIAFTSPRAAVAPCRRRAACARRRAGAGVAVGRRLRRRAGSRRRGSRPRTRSRAPRTDPRGEPACSTWPPFMTATRSLIVSASSWSCVTNTNVIPSSACSAFSSTCRSLRSRASRAPSGSSRRSTRGVSTSARASATRCCWPPESCAGLRFAKSPSCTSSSASRDPLALLLLRAAAGT